MCVYIILDNDVPIDEIARRDSAGPPIDANGLSHSLMLSQWNPSFQKRPPFGFVKHFHTLFIGRVWQASTSNNDTNERLPNR